MVHFIRFDAARRKIPHEIGGSTTLRIGDHVYVLTGVLVHEGTSVTSGHYYCDVVCPPHEQTGLAYQCNDTEYPSLIEEELGDDFKVAYMHIYELETGNEAAPLANTLGSDTRKRKSGEKLTTAEKQRRSSGLQANEEEQGLPATSDEQQRNGGLQANTAEQGLPAANLEQQRGRGLQANDDARNGKLIGNCRGSIPSTVESCTEEDEGRRRLKGWVEEKKRIHSMSPADRSKEEEKRAALLTKKIKGAKGDYPDIDTRMPSKAKTGAERNRTYLGGQSEEEKKQRCATEAKRLEEKREEQSEGEKAAENESAKMRMTEHRQRQSEEEKEQERSEARQRMTAKRAKVVSKPRDGLNAQMTLAGSFRVDTNHLGAMDEVS